MTATTGILEGSREQRILASARRLFAEKGYAGTTVSDIVRDAGVAQGTFYLYFDSKKDILLRLSNYFIGLLGDRVFAADDRKDPLPVRLRRMVETAFEVCDENCDLPRVLHVGAVADVKDVREAEWVQEHIRKPLVQMLAEGMKEGTIRPMDPVVAARLAENLVEEALHDCYVLDAGIEVERYKEGLILFLVNALAQES